MHDDQSSNPPPSHPPSSKGNAPTVTPRNPSTDDGLPVAGRPDVDGGSMRVFPAVVAWCVVLGLVALIVVGNIVEKQAPSQDGEQGLVALKVMELQSKFMVAQQVVAGGGEQLVTSAEAALNQGSIDQRLAYIAVAGELGGPGEALSKLESLRSKVEANEQVSFSERQDRLATILHTIYTDYQSDDFAAPSLDADAKVFLREELGWFGRLALTPAQDPDTDAREVLVGQLTRLLMMSGLGFVFIAILALGGLVGLIVVIIMIARKRVQSGIGRLMGRSHIMIETFALWMLLFFGLSLIVGVVGVPDRHAMAVQAIAFFLSLGVLGWPVVRGMSFGQVCESIGWTRGKSLAIEPWFGAAGYAMTLPLLGVGVVLVLLLAELTGGGGLSVPQSPGDDFTPTSGAAHPIIKFAGQGDLWAIAQLYLLAAIAAPIVEETIFRGVLYQHVRSVTRSLGLGVSIVLGTLVNGLIFSIIHPQGLIAVPALLALATGMTLLREWRGTIVPSMVLHGISNGLVMTFMVLAFNA